MSDDPKKRGSQDRSRANTTKTTKFGVSPDKFKAAVKKIGPLPTCNESLSLVALVWGVLKLIRKDPVRVLPHEPALNRRTLGGDSTRRAEPTTGGCLAFLHRI